MKNRFLTKVFAVATAAMIAVSNPIYASAQTPVTKDNFDAVRYANENADLKAAFGTDKDSLWTHYMTFGSNEGRKVYSIDGSAASAESSISASNFDYTRYANDYADLKAAFGMNKDLLWSHYVNFGQKEGRKVYAIGGASAPVANAVDQNNFDYVRYANEYVDMYAICGYDKDTLWAYYVGSGKADGRKAYPVGGTYVDNTAGARQKLDLLRKLMDEVVMGYPEFNFSGEAELVLVNRLIEKLLANGFNSNEVVKSDASGNNCANVLIDGVWYVAHMQGAWICRHYNPPMDFAIRTVE